MTSRYIHSHYDNLKVARNAPPEVIRAAYRSLSQKYHPDRNPEGTETTEIMSMLNKAYETLSDPVKRMEHDEWIAEEESKFKEPELRPSSKIYSSTAQSETSSYKYEQNLSTHSRSSQKGESRSWLLILGCLVGVLIGYFSTSGAEDRIYFSSIGALLGVLVGFICAAIWNNKTLKHEFNDGGTSNKKESSYSWILLVVLPIYGYIHFFMDDGHQKKQPPQSGQQTLTLQDKQRAANQANIDLNQGLPTMLDSETMLNRVESTASFTVYYISLVNFPSTALDQRFLMKTQEIIGRRNCASSDIRWAYDHDVYMKYIVSGSDNIQVGSFIISKIYCQRFR